MQSYAIINTAGGVMKKRLLVIDDEIPILEAIQTILEDMGYEVVTYSNSLEGEKVAITEKFDLILIDMRMPNKNGAMVSQTILKQKPEANIMIITAFPGDPIVREALDAGAKGVLKKPFEIGKIIDFLRET